MSDEDTKYWIYAGGLPYELTEGDIVCVFSQYGEIFEISLSRDRDTGKSRGFCFIKYEDPRSCELAVDNFHGTTIIGRRIKVSFATNTNAVKSRKPAIVAPQHQLAATETTKTQQREYGYDWRNSPRRSIERMGDHKRMKYRHESIGSDDDTERHSKYEEKHRDKPRHRDSDDRVVDLAHRNRHYDLDHRPQRRESPDRHRNRDPRENDRYRDKDKDRHRDSKDKDRHRDSSKRSSDHKHKHRESDEKSRHRDSDRKHRHRESEDKHRHQDSDLKHRHSKHRSSGDRKTHN